jgi:putative FmdB family regulatory protein
MPIYQYQCTSCKLRFELKQSFNDKPTVTCPACHGVAQRLFSPVPILFKGAGFYVTDSRIDKERNNPGVKTKEEKEEK